NLATNSSVCPTLKVVGARTDAPSTLIDPLATVDPPPVVITVLDQPAGSAEPENSVPTVGARMISPPAEMDREAPAPTVPVPNAAVVPVTHEVGGVMVTTPGDFAIVAPVVPAGST